MKTLRRPEHRSLLLLASIIISFLASSSAPTPLYATYANQWHFSPITTTIVFGTYAIAVLSALLVLGRASDHLGRKTVLLGALALQTVAMVAFSEADDIGALFAGRILQGVATGSALGTLGAAMLDIDRERGTRANAVAPGLGTGIGALFSGLIVQYLPAPTRLVYVVFIGVFAVQALGVVLLPRTTARRPGLRAALVPELVVPRHLRRTLLAVAPVLFAVWSLGGFYGSLAPALAQQLSGTDSVVIGGLGLFVLTAVSSVTTVAFARTPARTVMFLGIALLVLGSLGTLVAVEASSVTGFFASTFVSGIGFGAGFQGGMRTVVPLVAEHERAGVLSSIYVICYLGMGLPAIVAGILVVHGGGLPSATRDYSLFVVAFAVATLITLLRTRDTRHPTDLTCPAHQDVRCALCTETPSAFRT
ncbi:MFS transporter [Streptomyces malaysiensis subsp. malaysiensis]|uniref:MFS transporter n=1 Tax=Streptomyces malaysiensis TaxID=92644 RepID=A0ABX6VVU4_STRMQ|nr:MULTISPECIES: MFS transporter [Streptomyces]QPI53582.1 MFS transporter [Streptomyces solisilvae]UHH14918.1 MFS transporter [Streptomyces sp. HNM0561]